MKIGRGLRAELGRREGETEDCEARESEAVCGASRAAAGCVQRKVLFRKRSSESRLDDCAPHSPVAQGSAPRNVCSLLAAIDLLLAAGGPADARRPRRETLLKLATDKAFAEMVVLLAANGTVPPHE